MKIRILSILAICLMALAACKTESQKQLEGMVEETNKSCPMTVSQQSPEIVITEVTYHNNVVQYKVCIADSVAFDCIKTRQEQDRAEVDSIIVNSVARSSDPEVLEQLRLCREASASLCVLLVNGKGDELKFEFNPADIKD